jgi:VanZ family protein
LSQPAQSASSAEPGETQQRGTFPAPRRNLVKRWLPVVVWAMVISLFSTEYFAAHHTDSYIFPMFKLLLPSLSVKTIEKLSFGLRKMAHLTEYAILGILAWRAADDERRLSPRVAVLVLLGCAAYASFDEWHQTFVPGRIGSPIDVTIDTIGASLGLASRLVGILAFSADQRSRA